MFKTIALAWALSYNSWAVNLDNVSALVVPLKCIYSPITTLCYYEVKALPVDPDNETYVMGRFVNRQEALDYAKELSGAE